MPRAKNDAYKRKSAQALNHLAAAILDINDVYVVFESQMKMLQEQAVELAGVLESYDGSGIAPPSQEALQREFHQAQQNAERYAGYVHDLYSVMMGIAAVREHIILFIGEVWNLDEESVKVYIS